MKNYGKQNKKILYASSFAAMILCAVIGISAVGFHFPAKKTSANSDAKTSAARLAEYSLTQTGEKAYFSVKNR